MNALRDSDFKKLSPMARMHRAIEELDSRGMTIAAQTTPENESTVEAQTDLVRWIVSQKLVTARATASIERLRREAARRQARQDRQQAEASKEEQASKEENAHEGDDRPTETG